MKKLVILMVIAIAIMDYGCRNADDYVLTGQLYGSGMHKHPIKLKGKVKQFKQLNFWAKEENGKIVRGDVITAEDRKTTSLIVDLREEYNPAGIVLKNEFFNDKGEVSAYWTVEANDKIKNKALYYNNDTLLGYCKFTYNGSNLTEAKFFRSGIDTLMMSVVYDYNQNGNRIKYQTFNYKNEPGEGAEYNFNGEGLIVQIKSFAGAGKMISLTDFTYNAEGERIGEHIENFTKDVITDYKYEYEYDKKGNATKVIFYKNDKPFIYRVREIKYYD